MSSGPADYGLKVASGTVGNKVVDSNFDVKGFTPGQVWYKGFYYKADRVTGTNTDQIITKVRWWNSAGGELTATTNTININGNVGWTFYEAKHMAPANAVRGRLHFLFDPGGTSFQHDIWITAIRMAKTQFNATDGATAGDNLTDSSGNVLGDTDVDNGYVATDAQSTRPLFFNQNFDIVSPGSSPARPLGIIAQNAAGTISYVANLAYVSGTIGGDLAIGEGTNADHIAYFPMWRCNPKARYRVRGRIKGSVAIADGVHVRFNELDSEPLSTVNFIVDAVLSGNVRQVAATRNRTGGTTALTGGTSIENAALTTSYQSFDIQVIPTATAKYMGLGIWHTTMTASQDIHLESLIIEELGPEAFSDFGNLDNMPDGTTYHRILAAELTSGAHKLGISGSGFRLGDQRNLPAITAMNLGYKVTKSSDGSTTAILTYVSASGTPATATISIVAATVKIGSVTVSYNAMSAPQVTGTGGTTVTYHVYTDDPSYAGGTPAGGLQVVTDANKTTIYANDGRIYFGSIDVIFPTSGSGGGSGGEGGGGSCLAEGQYALTKRGWILAEEVVPGEDWLRCLTDDREGYEWRLCQSNDPGFEPCYRLVAEECGFEVIVSQSSPITTLGELTDIDGCNGLPLPCYTDADGAERGWWECVRKPEPVGVMAVRQIRCDGGTYVGGSVPGQGIATHNPKP